ncbi:MAG: prephenate dehydratase [Bacillota bacterium]
MKKIGYLGPPGTFTEAAAIKYAGGQDVDLVCCQSLPEIVSAVERGDLEEGVVPLENSTEGAVNQILDLVARSTEIMFRGEVIIHIRHNLLVRPGTKTGSVVKIMSHPQALAQCREYIAERLPGVEAVETSSTSQAARMVAGSTEPWAAIGTDLAAQNYGLEIAGRDIQDSCENATRFIILGKNDAHLSEDCKTSLVVVAKDRPGALYGILREFALREINLTRIESRPAKKRLGQYMFFIDLKGHRDQEKVREAIDSINEKSSYMRILGSYPVDNSLTVSAELSSLQELTLQEARAEIDLVDGQIVELLGIRTKLVEKIALLKKDPGRVRDEAREEEVLKRVRDIAAMKGAEPEMIEEIYRLIISMYVKLQKGRIQKTMLC